MDSLNRSTVPSQPTAIRVLTIIGRQLPVRKADFLCGQSVVDVYKRACIRNGNISILCLPLTLCVLVVAAARFTFMLKAMPLSCKP
jgi:hypothetical protein